MDGNTKKPRFQHIFSSKAFQPVPSVQNIIGCNLTHKDEYLDSDAIQKLGDLLSIYRSKKEETFRYIFLDKEFNIVEHIGLCAHNASCSPIGLNPNNKFLRYPSETPFLDLICGHIKENNLKLIIAHNHPSGNIEPSSGDCMTTSKLELKINQLGGLNKFLGHIILDHGQFNFYSPNTGWYEQNWETVLSKTNNRDPLLKKNIKPYFDLHITQNTDLQKLFLIAKHLDAKENWNMDEFTPVFCLNFQLKPVAVKFFNNEEVIKAANYEKDFFKFSNNFIKTAKTYGLKGFIPAALTEDTIKSLDTIARKDLFIDVIIYRNNRFYSWGTTYKNTDKHIAKYFNFPASYDIKFEQSDNFKKSKTSKEIKKNFSYTER